MNHKCSHPVTANYRALAGILCAAMFLMVAFSSGAVNHQSRTVRVGVYQNEPKIFMDQNGKASGIFIDLLNDIAAQEGWIMVYVPCEWTACLQDLSDGQIDLMPDVAYSVERDAIYDFPKTPVLESWSVVYANPRQSINNISQLDGRRVSVLNGSIQQTDFAQMMQGYGFKTTLVPADSNDQVFDLAKKGTVDAAIANIFFGDYFYQQYGLVKTTIVFDPTTLYYATAQGRNHDLLDAIDRHMAQWLQQPNSTYYKVLRQWGAQPPAYHVPSYLFWVIAIILVLFLTAVVMVLLLNRQVAARTARLVQTNAELQESEQHYQTLARISPVGIFRTDPGGATTYVNPMWCQISGLSADQAMGDGWLKAVHPDDRERLSRGWQESTQLRQASFSDYRFVRPDGSIAWVMGQAVPEVDPDDQIVGYVGTITDITERKQDEQEIHKHIDQLTALNKAALQLQKLQSPQLLADEIIKGLETILNYSYCSVLLLDESGQRLLPFVLSAQGQDAEFIARDKEFIQSQDLRLGKGITGWVARTGSNIRLGDVTGDPRYFGVRENIRSELCVPLKVEDQIIGVINIETDQPDAYSETDESVLETVAAQISIAIRNAQLHEKIKQHAVEMEQTVQERTAQLQAANKELESFSYSVSHDLRAPLRAISGFSEIIARRHRLDLNEEGRHYVDNIVQASEHMGHLIDDLLTYARLGRTGVRRDPVPLEPLLKEISRNMQAYLAEIHGVLDVAGDLPAVTGDQTLLSQVFTNLLENAFKYHKPDLPPHVTLTYDNEDGHVVVKVTDNGIGIPLEYQDKIFNVFQRLHSEEEYPGTGIGLATVRKSVELLGGSVWVESKVGEGSTFFVRLPKDHLNG